MSIDSPTRGFSAPDLPPPGVYDQCVRCGLCLPTCPTYVETLVETSSPRGRIALIKAVDEGRLDLTSPGFVHQMSECLDCRACEAVCPSGVAYGQLIEPARAQVARATADRRTDSQRLIRWFTLGQLFMKPGLLRFTAGLLRFYQRSGLRDIVRGSGLLRVFGLERMESLAPQMSERFFVPTGQRWPAQGPEHKATVFMHAGCVMSVAFAAVDEATVRVLNRAGCEVVAPAAQGCCGALSVHAGDLERGRELAKRNIVAFERSGADVYLINAAGCGSALKEYGHLFIDDERWHARAVEFSAKVRDATEFLDEIGIPPELGRLDAVVAYQDACHLLHAQRISTPPRRLLGRIPGLVLREIAERDICCGSAGVYNLTQPEMSERLKKRKVEHLLAVEPDVVVTANPGCALQIAAGLRAAGRSIPVKHVVELLDEAYAAYRPTKRASSASAASMLG
jgi:glycolate oxidase iron-sulfur subunit